MSRIGILSVPELDELAIEHIRRLLRTHLPMMTVTEETTAQNQRNWIEEILIRWVDDEELALILTIGGTYPAAGLGGDEIVPEATSAVIERSLPGLSEAMRAFAAEQTDLAFLDRGISGIRSRTVLVNLPAGAAAATLFLEGILDIIPALLAHLNGNPSAPRIENELQFVDRDEPQVSVGEIIDKGLNQTAEPMPTQQRKLDPAEFEAFLKKRKNNTL